LLNLYHLAILAYLHDNPFVNPLSHVPFVVFNPHCKPLNRKIMLDPTLEDKGLWNCFLGLIFE